MKYSLFLIMLFSVVTVGCVKKKKNPPQVPVSTAPARTVPSVPISADASLSAQEVQAVLTLHNQIRADVGVPSLSWSTAAAANIQDWVNQLAASSCNLQHRPNNAYGENLFMGTAGYYGVDSAIKSWESEKANYHGEPIGRNFSVVGHYTQMVWRDTSQVGCAKAICRNQVIIGCNYTPAGNYIGQTPY